MDAQIAAFVELVVDHPRRAPRWRKRMLASWVRDIFRRRFVLLDAAEPYQEIQRIQASVERRAA